MRRAALLLLLATASRASEPDPVVVAVDSERNDYFVHEPFRVRVRVAMDASFRRDRAVQPYRRQLDFPVQVIAPWLSALPGASVEAEEAGSLRIAVNDEVVTVRPDEPAGGRAFDAVVVERTIRAEAPGEIVLAAPVVRYAFATAFDEDALQGRVPRDRRDEVAEGKPLTVRIRPLPDEGRPAGFTNAVGRFGLRADWVAGADPAMSRLRLRVDGAGNLRHFDVPPPEALRDFHVYGTLDDHAAPVRTITYDVAPTRVGITHLPAIELAYFDPAPPGTYRVARTEPLALPGGARPPDRGSDVTTSSPARDADRVKPPAPAGLLAGAALAAASLVALALWRMRRARTSAPQEDARRRALSRLHAQLDAPAADIGAVLTEYLAVRLGCAPAAVITPDLADRLASAGVARDVAARTAAALERLVAARYGGDPAPASAEVRALADNVDASLTRASPGARPSHPSPRPLRR